MGIASSTGNTRVNTMVNATVNVIMVNTTVNVIVVSYDMVALVDITEHSIPLRPSAWLVRQ